MKRCVLFLSVLMSLSIFLQSRAHADFIYCANGPASLQIDSIRILLKPDVAYGPAGTGALMEQLSTIMVMLPDEPVGEGFVLCSLLVPRATEQLTDSLRTVSGVDLAEPVYRTPGDAMLVVGETFITSFGRTIPRVTIDSLCSVFHVVILEEMSGIPNIFLMNNTRQSGLRLVPLTNVFHELGTTIFSSPNFNCPIVKSAYRVQDPYHPYQVHSKKVIGQFNQASVWDFAGLTRPVTVAVIDDGISWQGYSVHDDLPASRILPGWDFNASTTTRAMDFDPSPGLVQAHGMGCAGIIAASHTTGSAELRSEPQIGGIFGLNPNATILPVKIFDDNGKGPRDYDWRAWDHAAAIYFAYSRADVLSNSWGFEEDVPLGFYPLLDSVLMEAPIVGRAGRGSPVFFASGNSPWYPTAFPAYLPSVFAVGAVRLDDSLWNYSQHDSTLDAVAPSAFGDSSDGVWTLDQMRSGGVNPYDNHTGGWECNSPNDENINCHFGGTSAACPVAAGIASLVLARDSMLTAYQVYDILRYSAVPIGSAIPNDKYGYGRVDAFRAVLSISHGDANNDAVLDVNDLYAIIDCLASSIEPFPSVLLADCNCDGIVDISDMFGMVDYLMGLSVPVKPCFEF